MSIADATLAPTPPAERSGRCGILALLLAWDARYRERRRLAALDDDGLADCGIAAGDAAAEARKPAWRA